MAFPQYEIRIRAIQALRRRLAGDGVRDSTELGRAAVEMQKVAEELPAEARVAYWAWGELLRAIEQLWTWSGAVREAELDADRYLRAAKQRAGDLLRRSDPGLAAAAVDRAAREILEVQGPEEVPEVSECLLAVRLPLPFPRRGEPEHRRAFQVSVTPKEAAGPAVVFLGFSINDQSVADVYDLRPNILHDLEVRLRLSRWPDGASALELVPLSVEPHGILDAPSFRIEPDGSRLRYSSRGRLLARVAHDSLARPLEVSYDVRARSELQDEHAKPSLVVKGQSRLLLRCVDQMQPWYGNQAIEEVVNDIRRQGRSIGLQDEELAALLTLSGGLGLIAFESLSNNVFPGEWSEAEFQESVRAKLRANPSIGSRLEEHSHAGGGITDLSLNRVRLELKVDDRKISIDQVSESYGQQTAQYAVGSDRRSGVLAVLCPAKEGCAPGPLQNDIAPRVIPPPTGGTRSVLVAVVLVRRDLAKPSALSR